MKNLIPPTKKIDWYVTISQQKREPKKSLLLGLREQVQIRYMEYEAFADSSQLVMMTESPFPANEKGALLDCRGTKSWVDLRDHIRKIQTVESQSICQMCGIGEPLTLDHYLPKEEFPEFTALSINLLPCCPICNMKKSDRWKDGTERIYINLYYDLLPSEKYLSCVYSENGGKPNVYFELIDSGQIERPFFNLISSHFKNLDLLRRYSARANSELFALRDPLQKMVKSLDRDSARAELFNHARGVKITYGQNYWRTAVAESLAESDDFLASAGL